MRNSPAVLVPKQLETSEAEDDEQTNDTFHTHRDATNREARNITCRISAATWRLRKWYPAPRDLDVNYMLFAIFSSCVLPRSRCWAWRM